MRVRPLLAIAFFLSLLVSSAGVALADDDDDQREGDHRGPGDREGREGHDRDDDGDGSEMGERRHKARHHRDSDKIVLQNDNISVWFHGGKPDIRVAFNGTEEDNASGYRVKLMRLFEAPENETQFRGSYPKINLAKRDDWNVDVAEGNDSVTLTMVRAEEQGIVTIVWHLDTANATVKYDLKVDNWQWRNESSRLVLDMLIVGRNLKNETGANVSVEDAGYIAWASSATASYGVNDTRTIPVDSLVKPSKDEHDEDEGDRSGAHILLVFNGTGGYGSLDYDPVFGVQSSSTQAVPLPGPALLVATVALAAIAFGRVSRLKRR